MRVWHQGQAQRCGRAGCVIVAGDPYLVITASGQRWTKIRCRAHAGQPVDAQHVFDDAPVGWHRVLPSQPALQPCVQLNEIATPAVQDWKQVAAGDRD